MNGERNAGSLGNVIFRGMSPNIPGNALKYFGECLKHSGEDCCCCCCCC